MDRAGIDGLITIYSRIDIFYWWIDGWVDEMMEGKDGTTSKYIVRSLRHARTLTLCQIIHTTTNVLPIKPFAHEIHSFISLIYIKWLIRSVQLDTLTSYRMCA